MNKVLFKELIAPQVTKLVIECPDAARRAAAGQFVAVVIDEQGERIPLTIADADKDKGTITLIFQQVGYTTQRLAALQPGQEIAHILGPLGHPTKTEGIKSVVTIGGGVGIAEVYPVSRAFKQAGSRVIGIIGSRTKELVILEKEMSAVCDQLFVTTDDGSYGRKGLVLDVLKDLFTAIERSTHTVFPDLVYVIGPVRMMQAVSEFTKGFGVRTIVSLNPLMVDATGMCGACRCTVAGKTVFGCVDGPEFDGHQVDFNELASRLRFFGDEEERMRREPRT
jgi:ferredoxin/flavodoxin---NADP+ reductase